MSTPMKLPKRANLYRDRYTNRLYLFLGAATPAGKPQDGVPDLAVFLDLLTHRLVHASYPDEARRFVLVEPDPISNAT